MANSNDKGFEIISSFPGYRNREDVSIIAPNWLVKGSKNVMTNVYGRIGIVKGYTLDGQSGDVVAPILASFDVYQHNGNERNLRAYLDPVDKKGHLQYRYVNSSGDVEWRDLKTDLNSARLRFVDWWDDTEKQSAILFCDGSANVYNWSGGIAEIDSVSSTTITKKGDKTWAEENFTTTGVVVIGGIPYAYTGGTDSTTLTGVTPDPTANNVKSGDICVQQVAVSAVSSISGMPATFKIDNISCLLQQIYYTNDSNRTMYISKINNYLDVTFTTPVRLVAEGALLTFDECPTVMVPQEKTMYVSCGHNHWYVITFTLSSDLKSESLSVDPLKCASQQGSVSQEATTNDKNDIVFLSHEPVLTTIGRVAQNLSNPQAGDISYPIINDLNNYNTDDAAAFYYKNFLFLAVPKEGIIRIFNQTNPTSKYWEAPIGYPISRFSLIGGELYGHSYNSNETYKLFDGYNFNGQPIEAFATFAYNSHGYRAGSKGYNQYFVEGYITQNGILDLILDRDMDGFQTETSYPIDGADDSIVSMNKDTSSLGKESLGKNPFGGQAQVDEGIDSTPPKFRVIKTMPPAPYFYEERPQLHSNSMDFRWELLAIGCRMVTSQDLNNNIKQ